MDRPEDEHDCGYGHLTEEEASEVERLARLMEAPMFVGGDGNEPEGHVAAAAMAVVVANHLAQSPEPEIAYERFGRMVKDMMRMLKNDRGVTPPRTEKESVH